LVTKQRCAGFSAGSTIRFHKFRTPSWVDFITATLVFRFSVHTREEP
jgi:hypothetical protein